MLKKSVDGREEAFQADHSYGHRPSLLLHYILDTELQSIVIASLERLCVATEVAVPGGAQRKP